MPKLDFENTCLTRSNSGYIPFKYKVATFEKSLFLSTLKLWNSLPKTTKHKDLIEFKNCMKQKFKPPKYKHFHKGSKLDNTLVTRIRVGR